MNSLDLVKNIVARDLGVKDYAELSSIHGKNESEMIFKARKGSRFKPNVDVNKISPPTGNPYSMLGLKLNSKGKLVK